MRQSEVLLLVAGGLGSMVLIYLVSGSNPDAAAQAVLPYLIGLVLGYGYGTDRAQRGGSD